MIHFIFDEEEDRKYLLEMYRQDGIEEGQRIGIEKGTRIGIEKGDRLKSS